MLASALNAVIRTALHNRLVVAALATFVLLFGAWQISQLPIDVFPDLNRPRVVVLTEAHGFAPEEVENVITFPLETALNGAAGVVAVRSTSGPGLSVIYVEFDWGTDIYNDRQVVNERLALAGEQLPPGVKPTLAPISSIMGQIVLVGMFSEPNEDSKLFAQSALATEDLNAARVPPALRSALRQRGVRLSIETTVVVERFGSQWVIEDPMSGERLTVLAPDATRPDGTLDDRPRVEVHRTTSPMELRTQADWVVRQQLLTIPGISQVFVMGGERKQFQVLVDPARLLRLGVTIHDVEQSLTRSNQNATGGYLDELGPNEYLVRALGRIQSLRELEEVVVKHRDDQSVLLRQVARVVEGPQVKRGDSTVAVRRHDGTISSGPAVVLTINKQPGADTREVTNEIARLTASLEGRLPADIRIEPGLYQQKAFIDLAVANVVEALRDGGLLVVVILFLFLLNFRTTFITLTAIPLSIVITGLVFRAFDLSINTMTLGGLAVAIGELVDDAIVDVENIFRRLRENRARGNPKPPLLVVFQASVEIRNSIVFGTMIVVLVFIPLFALGGMPGRLFTPLGIAYIVSIVSSLLVSMTVTPVLSYWLLSRARTSAVEQDGLLVRQLKRLAAVSIGGSLKSPKVVLGLALVAVAVAGIAASRLERDLLPPFDEGAVQVNVQLPPGTSLAKSNEVGRVVDQRLREIPDVVALVRKTGRAELDEHAEGVHTSEIILSIDPDSHRSRSEVLDDVRHSLDDILGVVVSVEQPLQHLISHMLSGVKAQVAVKLYGDELEVLRGQAERMRATMESVAGIEDLFVEPQVVIPQLRIDVDGHQLQQYGLTRGDVTEFIETAMNGDVVSEVLEGQRKFDLLVRLDEPYREDIETLRRLTLQLPGGGTTKLGSVVTITRGGGPNTINRENVRRRIVVQCNVKNRGLVDVVSDIKQRLAPIEESLPQGYLVEYGGQFEAQQSASRMIAVLFAVSLAGMFLLLYSMFRSVNLALQVMVALPMAFIGSVAAIYFTGQTLTVAAMVGFISLCGIATRNGILLINHYLHLVQFEGEGWTREMIVRAGQERLVPVLMTALTSGIGLVPLALAAGEPGKEILYPVATVIIGGLISSTLLEFLVRPAFFWEYGLDAAREATEADEREVELVEEKHGRDALVIITNA